MSCGSKKGGGEGRRGERTKIFFPFLSGFFFLSFSFSSEEGWMRPECFQTCVAALAYTHTHTSHKFDVNTGTGWYRTFFLEGCSLWEKSAILFCKTKTEIVFRQPVCFFLCHLSGLKEAAAPDRKWKVERERERERERRGCLNFVERERRRNWSQSGSAWVRDSLFQLSTTRGGEKFQWRWLNCSFGSLPPPPLFAIQELKPGCTYAHSQKGGSHLLKGGDEIKVGGRKERERERGGGSAFFCLTPTLSKDQWFTKKKVEEV